MKEIEFVSEAAQREFAALPRKIQERFALDLEALKKGQRPFSDTTSLKESVGAGAIELKKNGRPAYRLVYCDKENTIFILSAFTKTTNGVDRPAMKTAESRYAKMVGLIEERKGKGSR